MASMHVINAEGRRISLLNDDSASHSRPAMHSWPAVSYTSTAPSTASYQYPGYRSSSSSPHTPELLRSESYDSQHSSNEPVSPMTPNFGHGYYASSVEARTPYEDYADFASAYGSTRPHYSDSRAGSYDADSVTGMPTGDKAAKRYPCRYKDTHRCDKTFTTSGHASRHSKIHTAEKAVPCSFEGCTKKFTRADNMKQHLDTHYKDKSRYSSSRPSLSSSDRRTSTCSKSSSKSKSHGDAWDMSGLGLPLQRRPSVTRNPSSGLDALAMAVACQRDA